MGADGIKTGYLAVEKYSLASSIEKKGRRLLQLEVVLKLKILDQERVQNF